MYLGSRSRGCWVGRTVVRPEAPQRDTAGRLKENRKRRRTKKKRKREKEAERW